MSKETFSILTEETLDALKGGGAEHCFTLPYIGLEKTDKKVIQPKTTNLHLPQNPAHRPGVKHCHELRGVQAGVRLIGKALAHGLP